MIRTGEIRSGVDEFSYTLAPSRYKTKIALRQVEERLSRRAEEARLALHTNTILFPQQRISKHQKPF